MLSRPLTHLVLGLALFAGACDRQSGDKVQPQASTAAESGPAKGVLDRSHAGSTLPEFVLQDPAGRQLRLSSLKGKPFLLNLWATWCRPCVTELPQLEALTTSGDLRVVTVSQDSGDAAKVAGFLKDRKLGDIEPWLDPKNDLAFHFGGGTLPTSVLYDEAGREVWRYMGERDWSSGESRALLGLK